MPAGDFMGRASDRIARILGELADVLSRELLALTGRLDSRGGIVNPSAANLANVVEIRRQLESVALQEGFPAIAEALSEELSDLAQEVLRDFPGLGAFAPDVTGDLERFFAGQADEVARALREDVADDLGRAIRRGVATGAELVDLQADIAQALDTSLGRAAVLVDRGIRDFGEETVKRLGDAAAEALGESIVYEYVGPDDDKTRPYCEARRGRYLTQAQADALDPQERFNCRHGLAPLTLEEAREQGLRPFSGG